MPSRPEGMLQVLVGVRKGPPSPLCLADFLAGRAGRSQPGSADGEGRGEVVVRGKVRIFAKKLDFDGRETRDVEKRDVLAKTLAYPRQRSRDIFIPCVPASVTPAELTQLCLGGNGGAACAGLEFVARMVPEGGGSAVARSSVLLRFSTSEAADQCYARAMGEQFPPAGCGRVCKAFFAEGISVLDAPLAAALGQPCAGYGAELLESFEAGTPAGVHVPAGEGSWSGQLPHTSPTAPAAASLSRNRSADGTVDPARASAFAPVKGSGEAALDEGASVDTTKADDDEKSSLTVGAAGDGVRMGNRLERPPARARARSAPPMGLDEGGDDAALLGAQVAAHLSAAMRDPAIALCFDASKFCEVPLCLACCERLDPSVSFAVGTRQAFCGTSAAPAALAEWDDGGCAVCSALLQLSESAAAEEAGAGTGKSAGAVEAQAQGVLCCSKCFAFQNLWCCLLCGHLGCGRYSLEHARLHWEATGHRFSMELTTRRIWDYEGDVFAHGVLQLRGGSSTVLLEDPWRDVQRGGDASGADASTTKHADLQQQYHQLLASQLDEQRRFYESKLADEAARLTAMAMEKYAVSDEERAKLQALQSDVDCSKARLESALARLRDCAGEAQVLREENRRLVAVEQQMKEQVEAVRRNARDMHRTCEEKLADLHAQVDDLAAHVRCQDQLSETLEDSEVQDGAMFLSVNEHTPRRAHSATKKRRPRSKVKKKKGRR